MQEDSNIGGSQPDLSPRQFQMRSLFLLTTGVAICISVGLYSILWGVLLSALGIAWVGFHYDQVAGWGIVVQIVIAAMLWIASNVAANIIAKSLSSEVREFIYYQFGLWWLFIGLSGVVVGAYRNYSRSHPLAIVFALIFLCVIVFVFGGRFFPAFIYIPTIWIFGVTYVAGFAIGRGLLFLARKCTEQTESVQP